MTTGDSSAMEKVFVVDDDPAICEGLCELLESAGLQACQYGSAEEFFNKWDASMVGCLVLDVRLPGMGGLEVQAKLAESGVSLPVIIMTAHGDMPMVRKALKAGAVEFLIKPFQDEELLQAVEQAFALERANRRKDSLVHSLQARIETLTERERQVMALVTAGLTNKEIAERLFLSVVTVKLHRGQMMKKMHAETLADLVRMWERINPADASGDARLEARSPSRT